MKNISNLKEFVTTGYLWLEIFLIWNSQRNSMVLVSKRCEQYLQSDCEIIVHCCTRRGFLSTVINHSFPCKWALITAWLPFILLAIIISQYLHKYCCNQFETSIIWIPLWTLHGENYVHTSHKYPRGEQYFSTNGNLVYFSIGWF